MAYNLYDTLVLLTFFCVSALVFSLWRNSYFDRKGIKTATRPVPFFGNFFNIFVGKEHITETLYKVYNASPGQRYTGFFSFMTPTIFVRDLDIIKRIGVKDFEHFVDHKVFLDEEAEPLFGSNLFFLKGQKWRDMRATLSPAFTGSKMKGMYPLITECSEQYRDYLINELKDAQDGEVREIEIKETMTRFTNDVIASTAFGFKINSFEDQKNKFYTMGKLATNFSGWQFIKFQAYAFIPTIMKKLKLNLFPNSVVSFFSNLVHTTIKNRERNGIVRYDMIHLLMLAKKGNLHADADFAQLEDTRFSNVQGQIIKPEALKREWSDDEITAQAVAFILAGFGTPSSLLCFVAYELAKHPEIQHKLHCEIDEVYARTKGQPTYADLQTMKYIDMVISETLRLWPPDGLLERVCVKPYTLPPQNEYSNKEYEVKTKDEFLIPIFAIHRDPEYFPEPETFDPERFSDENKHLIKPFSFIPFGIGPRLCIGARFALMEAKSVLFHMLAHFELSTTSQTPIPFVLAKDTFNMHPEKGLWLGIKRRKININ